MISNSLVSKLLRFTAGLNLIAGLASIADPQLHARLLLGPDFVIDGLMLRYHFMTWSFIAAMGIGYAVAARAPERQSALVLAGGIGKILAAASWIEMLSHGFGTPLMIAGILTDGALGCCFIAYCVQLGREKQNTGAGS